MRDSNSTPTPSVFDYAMLWIFGAGVGVVFGNMAEFVWRLLP